MQRRFIFLDYLQLRRRVEKRLAHGGLLLLHTLLFILVTGLLLAHFSGLIRNPYPGYLIYPGFGMVMLGWSSFLLLHTVLAWRRSGVMSARREEIVEHEMRERLEKGDSYLGDNPKDAFRIFGLLEEDILKRAGIFYTLGTYNLLNVLIWCGSLFSDGLKSSFAWQMVPLLGVLFLPVLLYGFWRRSRHEAKVKKLIGAIVENEADEKPKIDRLVYLSDDGELVDEGELKTKRG